MISSRVSKLLCAIAATVIPVFFYLANTTHSLGFADAAEFALVTKLLSTAHPPGFPAYVTLGYLWSQLLTPITQEHVWSMIIFSAICSGLAGLFLFLACRRLISVFFAGNQSYDLMALAASGAFSYGVTVWYWSGSVEVYALQALATALALYGFIRIADRQDLTGALIAGTGIGLGLANHHLTMILLLPFLIFFSYPGALSRPVVIGQDKNKKQKTNKQGWNLFPLPRMLQITALVSALVCLILYGWMFARAGQEFAFEFGNPDNVSRLLYHMAGGAWMKNTAQEVKGIVALRFPYFMKLIYEQYLLFIPFLITGWVVLLRTRMYRLIALTLGYFLVVLIYQLRIDQTSDTDAYLIPAFAVAALAVAVGIYTAVAQWRQIKFLLPVVMLVHIAIGYSKTDKKDFNVSESLMKSLDESAPDSAVILVSDWTLAIQYHYFRIAENFRPDLTVLNYDIKFTNYRSLPIMYPDLYKGIAPAYDKFVSMLGAAHPQEIYNTGCTLDTPELLNAYKETVVAIQEYCKRNNRIYMVDPKAFVFQMQNGLMSSGSHVSGCFVTLQKTEIGKNFINLPFRWLDSEITLREPAATDKLVDFEAMLDFHRNYYRTSGDTINYTTAENSFMRIKTLQRKVKLQLPFVFRSK
jgi:Protein of unknown function (DUF2723)